VIKGAGETRIRHCETGSACVAVFIRIWFATLVASCLFGVVGMRAADSSISSTNITTITNFYAYYEKIYLAARKSFQAASNDYQLAWQLGRACFDLGEFATNNTQRAAVAAEGIAACRQVVMNKPEWAAGHYYLALNLAQLARTKSLGALKLVREMERYFNLARGLDPKIDYAGPDRGLGLLHRDAPGWPISIGNKSKARQHLLRAAELAGQYPENPLNLVESYLVWGEKKPALAKLKELEAILGKARTNYVGDPWAASWRDWSNRWHSLTNKLGRPGP
jgi:hypothetical protein